MQLLSYSFEIPVTPTTIMAAVITFLILVIAVLLLLKNQRDRDIRDLRQRGGDYYDPYDRGGRLSVMGLISVVIIVGLIAIIVSKGDYLKLGDGSGPVNTAGVESASSPAPEYEVAAVTPPTETDRERPIFSDEVTSTQTSTSAQVRNAYIQTGALSQLSDALQAARDLSQAGFLATVVAPADASGYRVVIGFFATEGDAQQYLGQTAGLHPDAWVRSLAQGDRVVAPE